MKNNKIIISGPPGSGKTTIINELSRKGYATQFEINATNTKPQSNKLNLNYLIFKNRLKQYQKSNTYCSKLSNKKLQINNLCFFDRSMIDVIAYMNFSEMPTPLDWKEIISTNRYANNIFYAPIWKEIYMRTDVRPESYDDAKKIDYLLRKAFLKFNYNIIELPKLDINKRVNFILNQI